MQRPSFDKATVEHQYDTLVKMVLTGEANDRIAKGTCIGVRINENNLIEAVSSGIKTLISKSAYSSIGSSKKQHCEKLNKNISEYQSELDKVQSFIRSLYENFVEGIISNNEYSAFKADYSEKAANLKEKIRQAKSELAQLEAAMKTRELVAKSMKAFKKNGKLTAEVVPLFVKRIEITHDTGVNIEYNNEILLGEEAV